MPGREPSAGELAEDIHEIKELLKGLPDELDKTYVRRDVNHERMVAVDARFQTVETRVFVLEGRSTWIGRAAITGLLMPILVSVIVGIILGALALR